MYHTNVMLSIGRRSVVICADAIHFDRERDDVLDRLAGTGRTIIEISLAQMRSFAANLLELATPHQRSVIVMSTTAGQALTHGQIGSLGKEADLLQVPIATIERVGGGSVRCMLAEIFLPRPS